MGVINREYRNTPIGLLPKHWEVKKLGEVSEIDSESLPNNTNENYEFEYISLSDVDSEELEIKSTKQIFKNAPSRARRVVKQNDILFATVRPNLQGFTIIKNKVNNLIASTGFAVISCSKANNEFVYYCLFSNFISKQLYFLLVGTNYPAVNSSDVKNLKIPIPPLHEQQRIATILSTWDKAIDNVKNIIEQLQLRNKGLAQALLTGKKRVKGFERSKWEIKSLNECLKFTPREVKKPTNNYLALGLRSHGKGVFHKQDIEPETVAMEFLYEVKENDLIINITFAWEQAVAIIGKKDEGGLVSHRFPTYVFNNQTASIEFFRHFIISKYFKFLLELISPGGAGRNRVMSKTDFLKLEIKLPSVIEQKAIANILNASSTELTHYQQKLQQLQIQKKGLMQQLLTGKVLTVKQ